MLVIFSLAIYLSYAANREEEYYKRRYSKVNLDLLLQAKANIDRLVGSQAVRLRNQVISRSEYTRTELLSGQYALQLRSAAQNYRNELQNLKLVTGSNDNIYIEESDIWNPHFRYHSASLFQQQPR